MHQDLSTTDSKQKGGIHQTYKSVLENVRQMEQLLLESQGNLCMQERGLTKEKNGATTMSWTIQYSVWRLTESAFFSKHHYARHHAEHSHDGV
jgi:hypothetical protein